jgi:transposase InsO family protein
MITETAIKRARILTFWQNHGLEATKEAFNVSRATLFRWQKKLKKSQGKLEGLNKESTIPRNKRKRVVDQIVSDFIINQRKIHPRLSKEKISVLLKDGNIANLSASTVGRIMNDLKKSGELPKYSKFSLSARTGRLIERKPLKRRKKLRRKDYKPKSAGDLLQLDTIIKFINGIKRYIITAIDLKSDFGFAYAYTNARSRTTKDFFQKLETVAPFSVKRIQTDNGSEFDRYFRDFTEEKQIIHFHNYPKCPKMNAYIERFNRTLQEEFLNYNKETLAYDLNGFNGKLIDYLLWYNTKRPHWSLGLISPLRYICNQLSAKESQMLWTDTMHLTKPLYMLNCL